MRFLFSPMAFLIAFTLLVACDSAEERAEKFFQRGLALIEEGDVDRAIVELRNVLELDQGHREARRTMANLFLNEKEDAPRAYRTFLRLAEQYPDDLEARVALGQLAFLSLNWDELERHGSKAEELDSNDLQVQVLGLARGYRAAAIDEDEQKRRDVARAIIDLQNELPDSEILRRLTMDSLIRDGQLNEALIELAWLTDRRPKSLQLWNQRANILVQLQDLDALEAHLREMIDRFPDDISQKATLIRFYLSRQEQDKAEAFLRELVAASPDNIGPRVDLIRFISEVHGLKAARTEVAKAIAENPGEPRYEILSASMQYQDGERDAGVATLEAAVSNSEPSETTREMKATLARMLLGTGNTVGARRQVEEILEEDPEHVTALKLQATWLIEADDPDAAISGLRIALDKANEDVEAMTLTAQAYLRAGQPELARDFLSLAVDASGNAPEPSLRYARLLIGEESYQAAEDILLPALRRNPGNFGILQEIGRLYILMEDFGRVDQVVNSLRALDTSRAAGAANNLDAERISRQNGASAALNYLEGIANAADASLNSKISLVRARLATGDTEAAMQLTREMLEQDPENENIIAVSAAVAGASGLLDEAEALYRDIIKKNPKQSAAWLELSRIESRKGNRAGARETVKAALDIVPGDANLLWAQASLAEQDGDLEEAISIYEKMYERDSNSIVIANNLASLLSTHRSDPESLERAWVVARRFKDVDVPQLQDTYGWLLHLRGASQDALSYLETAAKGLSQDPLVQYHLAVVYQSLDRPADALETFQRAVTLAGPADQRPQIQEARTQLTELRNTQPPKDN